VAPGTGEGEAIGVAREGDLVDRMRRRERAESLSSPRRDERDGRVAVAGEAPDEGQRVGEGSLGERHALIDWRDGPHVRARLGDQTSDAP
jgi:hypothetical protein